MKAFGWYAIGKDDFVLRQHHVDVGHFAQGMVGMIEW